ncbi:serine/threonine protein kinase [Magnaporthiopsis poae ATCC 64411]|uniref:Serine/threonine protein kinase n=1 Tax=Magnaporthiopsis poae (strain ATCC 64411 / 73-15) TaxID=644358 RepID=A0A0C4E855_MAGP6|nr:serine/threonine protein kinase [Magnaporthiopsis poae ATCC 64411]
MAFRAVVASARRPRSPSSFCSMPPIRPFLSLSHFPQTQTLRHSPTHQRNQAARMPSTVVPPSKMAGRHLLPIGSYVLSPSGKAYLLQEVVYEHKWSEKFVFRVYRASYKGRIYILKDIIPGDFKYITSLQKLVDDSPNVRTFVDSIPDRNILVYSYREQSLFAPNVQSLPPAIKRRALRDALAGLADLHDRGIYHTDVKPHNIMMDLVKEDDNVVGVCNVQITDLETAVVLPEGSGLTDRQSGSTYWRSPEAWARGVQDIRSDVFSFGIVVIYVWMGDTVLYSAEAGNPNCSIEEQAAYVPRSQISSFGDRDEKQDFLGFVEYHGDGDTTFIQGIHELIMTFDAENPRKPFPSWHDVDQGFQDLVSRMTCLDPRRRITAREALQHPWLCD